MTPTYSGNAPHDVEHPVMVHSWQKLTFVHWSYPIDEVQRLLPKGLTVEPFDGKAWVGLVPFLLSSRAPGLPEVPWVSRFPETNVRTYVTDAAGRPGVWFFSLDADRFGAVATARATYRLPYFWSTMRIHEYGSQIRYDSVRRSPGPNGARCHALVNIGDMIPEGTISQLDHFLTARWALYSAHKRGLHYAKAVHQPWPLQKAELVSLDEDLVVAAGLPQPTGQPHVRYASRVDVRIGVPHRVNNT